MKIDIQDSNYIGSCQFCPRDHTVDYKVVRIRGRTTIRMCLDCFKEVYEYLLEEIRGETTTSN